MCEHACEPVRRERRNLQQHMMGQPSHLITHPPTNPTQMVASRGSGGGRMLLPALSRQVVSISSWFRVPEQGMKKFEPLSRGTAFCIQQPAPAAPPSPSSHSRRRRVVVTCSHVVAPYRWREHFKEPWLEFVKDAHVECRLQLWKGGGLEFSESVRVGSPLHFHPTLDLCAFAYPNQGDEEDDGEGGDAIMGGADAVACRGVEGFRDGGPLEEGEALHFLGFPIHDPKEATSASAAAAATASSLPRLDVQSLRHTTARALAPHVVDRDGRRYARTVERLAVGMSGGPVLDAEGRCVGLFQGILPPPPKGVGKEAEEGKEEDVDAVLRPLQEGGRWALHAAFIPMAPVLQFVGKKGLFSD